MRTDKTLWLLLLFVTLMGVAWMPQEIYPGDPIAMREESRSILLHQQLSIEAETQKVYGNNGQYVVQNPRNGLWYSKYGSMTSLMFMVPLSIELLIEGSLPPRSSPSRAFYLNLYNVLLSVLCAALIYRAARRFNIEARWAACFIILAFYSTYTWNYLRAQNSEIMQLLFFACTVNAFLNVIDRRRLAPTKIQPVALLWLSCAALTFCKVSYILCGPLFALGLVAERRQRTQESWVLCLGKEIRLHLIPGLLLGGCVGLLNFVKFGAPWLTGYHAWHPEEQRLSGDLLTALRGLFFTAQHGLPYCFPLLLLAVPMMRRWLRRWPVEYGTLLLIATVYLLLIGKLPIWNGEWCYGPRYWLFVLPFVSLPAIEALQRLIQARGAWRLILPVIIAGLSYSTWLQVQVISHSFFAFYHLRAPLHKFETDATRAYFDTKSFGAIYHDLDIHRERLDSLAWWDSQKELLPKFNAKEFERRVVNYATRPNFYWHDKL